MSGNVEEESAKAKADEDGKTVGGKYDFSSVMKAATGFGTDEVIKEYLNATAVGL